MNFIRLDPHPDLEKLIECYWMIQSDDREVRTEKIIPDGFTELIYHYGDVFRSKITGEWRTQSKSIMAGQISNHFQLQNTGTTGIVAIKLKPAALTQLFNLNMSQYTDHVIDMDALPDQQLIQLRDKILPFGDEHAVKAVLDDHFMSMTPTESPVNGAIDLIFKTNGQVTVKELTEAAGVGERQLERLFKRYVGLSPKYYARIIRFNYIFQLIQAKDTPWAEIVYRAGYYDQSHFIRNFKTFAGEDPSAYFFDEKNMANFFLKK